MPFSEIKKRIRSPQHIHKFGQSDHFLTIQPKVTSKPDVLDNFCRQIRFQRQKIYTLVISVTLNFAIKCYFLNYTLIFIQKIIEGLQLCFNYWRSIIKAFFTLFKQLSIIIS